MLDNKKELRYGRMNLMMIGEPLKKGKFIYYNGNKEYVGTKDGLIADSSFDSNTFNLLRIGREMHSLILGTNGALYAIVSSCKGGRKRLIKVCCKPNSDELQIKKSIPAGNGLVDSLIPDKAGNFYAGTCSGKVIKFDSDLAVINTADLYHSVSDLAEGQKGVYGLYGGDGGMITNLDDNLKIISHLNLKSELLKLGFGKGYKSEEKSRLILNFDSLNLLEGYVGFHLVDRLDNRFVDAGVVKLSPCSKEIKYKKLPSITEGGLVRYKKNLYVGIFDGVGSEGGSILGFTSELDTHQVSRHRMDSRLCDLVIDEEKKLLLTATRDNQLRMFNINPDNLNLTEVKRRTAPYISSIIRLMVKGNKIYIGTGQGVVTMNYDYV